MLFRSSFIQSCTISSHIPVFLSPALFFLLKASYTLYLAPGFQNQASVMLPVHRVAESSLIHVARPQGSRIKPHSCSLDTGFKNKFPVMFPVHRVPQLNLSHIPRPEGSTIKPQSCCQATVPPSSLSHVPRPMVSRIKPQSYSQATWFQNQTSFLCPGHRFQK